MHHIYDIYGMLKHTSHGRAKVALPHLFVEQKVQKPKFVAKKTPVMVLKIQE